MTDAATAWQKFDDKQQSCHSSPRCAARTLGDVTTVPTPRRLAMIRAGLRHVVMAFRSFNAANVELWERYLRAQRPWEGSRR